MDMDSTNRDRVQEVRTGNPPARYTMTARQADLFRFIRAYILQHGFGPSFDEMCEATGLASKSGIHRLLKGLEERGYIERLPNRARAVRLIGVKL